MANGKTQTQKPATSTKGVDPRKMGEFVGEVKAELKRVSWTSKEELKVYTKIVVGATFIIGAGLYFTDIFMQKIVWGLGSLFHLVFG